MDFTDIHAHLLSSIDDGPKDDTQMFALLDALYHDGAKCICCTPHYHPGYYGHNTTPSSEKYQALSKFANEKYPGLTIFLGNELHYSQGCVEWVEAGLCRTLNGTRYVLVDFDFDERYQVIEFAVLSFLRHGYIPVLAHIERYLSLHRRSKLVMRLRDIGAIIQVNASSVLRPYRYPLVRKILQQRIVDVIASDAHNLEGRPPTLSKAYIEVSQRYGKDYADELFLFHPNAILNVQTERRRCADE